MIRQANPKDSSEIGPIYNHYIANSIITFEESAIATEEMAKRIEENFNLDLPWLVAEDKQGKVVGYAYASQWKGRCAYRFSVEVTVYLAPEASGQGLGSALYQELFAELKKRSYHSVIAGISLPNPASIALHEKMGMAKVAHFKQIGYKFNQWIDVGYWQGTL